jgi:hypothetical protein
MLKVHKGGIGISQRCFKRPCIVYVSVWSEIHCYHLWQGHKLPIWSSNQVKGRFPFPLPTSMRIVQVSAFLTRAFASRLQTGQAVGVLSSVQQV